MPINKKVLSGGQLAGGNPTNERVENDYYATDPRAVEMLLRAYDFGGFVENDNKIRAKMLEPCVGGGHIAEAVKTYPTYEHTDITGVDLVDKGYPNTIVTDFLTWENGEKFDFIISNPPYSLAQEFIEHGLELLKDNGQMAMFLKIQFLEGAKRKIFFEDNPPKYIYVFRNRMAKRKIFFEDNPPKYIYVFRNRMATWNNGQSVDPSTGKRWATTMCHAWFIWEKGFKGEPIVRWL